MTFTQPAYRFRSGVFTPIPLSTKTPILLGLDKELSVLKRNIELLISGAGALNILLWGEKGGGKSSAVKYLLKEYTDRGLRIIEFSDDDYYNIYILYNEIRAAESQSFIIYFDDVSFDETDDRYRKFKSIVEGGLEEKPKNVVFAATSNRRHFIAETPSKSEDIYSRDLQNEQSSLYARFGIAIGFYPLGRELYLEIAAFYLKDAGIELKDGWEVDAESYAIERGGRSGRVAEQYAKYKKILSLDID
ncbi:MAG: ATP-binding protein [Deferribacteraceae bacterium]|jgi:predicted AAA+ superfamily ATPase|nr:ATP-binding protein [Deferribacteraceae bacterium]